MDNSRWHPVEGTDITTWKNFKYWYFQIPSWYTIYKSTWYLIQNVIKQNCIEISLLLLYQTLYTSEGTVTLTFRSGFSERLGVFLWEWEGRKDSWVWALFQSWAFLRLIDFKGSWSYALLHWNQHNSEALHFDWLASIVMHGFLFVIQLMYTGDVFLYVTQVVQKMCNMSDDFLWLQLVFCGLIFAAVYFL